MKVLDLKHIQQRQESSCGAACLAMLYDYFGLKIKEEYLWDQLKVRRLETKEDFYIPVKKMYEHAKRNGFYFIVGRSYWDFEKAFQPITALLNAKIPVLVIQRGHPNPKYGHCRVVVGINNKNIYIKDPEENKSNTVMTKKQFYEEWEESGEEVTGGVLFAIFPKDKAPKIANLLIDDVTTNYNDLIYKNSGSNE